MKLKKILNQLNAHIDKKKEQDMQAADGLSKVLKKLKRKEQKLQSQLEHEKDMEEREMIEQELKIVHSQRKKGIQMLSDLRKKTEDKSAKGK